MPDRPPLKPIDVKNDCSRDLLSMDSDVVFQTKSADERMLAVVTPLTHFDGATEFQVDLYVGDSLGSSETHYTDTLEQARELAKALCEDDGD